MEISSGKWLSEWEWLSDDHYQMAYYDDHLSFGSISPNESNSSFSNISPNISTNNFISPVVEEEEEDIKRPVKQLRMMTNNCPKGSDKNNKSPIFSSPNNPSPPLSISSKIISFENSNSSSLDNYYGDEKDYPMTYTEGAKRAGSSFRSPVDAKEHVISERKRRERMGQLLISLSALIPNLKKVDRASIIEGAANYVKQLQERVETLEEQVAKKTVESAIYVKKTQIYVDEESSSSDDQNIKQEESLPEIEARVSERDVLITIHCEKNMGSLVSILNEVEKLNLLVISSNVVPFGRATLHVTISAQMKDEISSITATNIVKNLKLAMQRTI